jgi:hypothetical protein
MSLHLKRGIAPRTSKLQSMSRMGAEQSREAEACGSATKLGIAIKP